MDNIKTIPAKLKRLKVSKSFAIITDSKVKKLYGGKLLWNLRKAGFKAELFSFPHGEKSKNLQTIERLANQMVEADFDRSSCVLALGGGVVGDMAGLIASTFMRGIPYVQIPTTLVAMTDSATGGKTGVNLKAGKNLFGTFHQPSAVFIDPHFLKTLPVKQIRNGLAEAIKCGVIRDEKLFAFIEKNIEKLLKLEPKAIKHIIEECVKIKVEIVKKDEKEMGLRRILNYGHTFGHVLEKRSDYTLLHGFAISLGMVLANQKAVELGLLKKPDAERIKNLLKATGLPVYVMHKPTLKDLSHDKKMYKNFIHLILPTKIGKITIHKELLDAR
jgi:3-dehydroquinate synthase